MVNENYTEEQAKHVEASYRKLHRGLFDWADEQLPKNIEQGYVESAAGFKLRLPDLEEYREMEEWIGEKDKDFWEVYREGKDEFKALKQSEEDIAKAKKESEEDPEIKIPALYKIKNRYAYDLYMDNRKQIRDFFSKKGQYMRLTLNNPSQAKAAHQTKYAKVLLFEEIKKNGHLGIIYLCNVPHDEFVLEAPSKELALQYRDILEDCMKKGGNHFLTNNKIKMKADAYVNTSWGTAKKECLFGK